MKKNSKKSSEKKSALKSPSQKKVAGKKSKDMAVMSKAVEARSKVSAFLRAS
jgi:hypothetical protein